jgi:hypothetical protein
MQCTNEIYNKIVEIFRNANNLCLEEKSVSRKKRNDKNWCTDEIRYLISLRDSLFRRWKNSFFIVQYQNNYKKIRNRVNTLIKKVKINYLQV